MSVDRQDDERETRAARPPVPLETSPDTPPAWWTLTPDESLLRELLPEHRPEYC